MLKKAFTLAEVLVTLGIIGVVAAMTMPTLINNTGNEKYVAKLKKVQSLLGQATINAVEEHGMIQDWGFRDGSNDQINRIYGYYAKSLKVAKDCGNDTTNPCTAHERMQTLAGTQTGWNNAVGMGGNIRSFTLVDGTTIFMDGYCSNEDKNLFGVTRNTLSNFVLFLVDVNGDKKPNKLGRDIFLFLLTQDGIVPAGADVSANDSDCKQGGAGYHCTARVIQEGMNY